MVPKTGRNTINTDWACFLSARNGDKDSWRELLENHRERLTALALLITGSSVAAEDVVQETFVQAYRAKLNHSRGTVNGFLGTIAYRLARKEALRTKRHPDITERELIDTNENPLDGILRNERDKHVAEIIMKLDEDHRNVLSLRFYGGHSYEEIAALVDIPVGTVKSRLFYAVKFCREKLKERGFIE